MVVIARTCITAVGLLSILFVRTESQSRSPHVTINPGAQRRRRRRPMEQSPQFSHSLDSSLLTNKPTIDDTTCLFIKQPLNHFSGGGSPAENGRASFLTFQQRYCLSEAYSPELSGGASGAAATTAAPIFLYVGNESPVDVYINNTGLMWELAPRFNATLVFAEHRYEGLSKPNFTDIQQRYTATNRRGKTHLSSRNNTPPATPPVIQPEEDSISDGCMSYATSAQALQDYIALLSHLDPSHVRPVIVFGGSYGGMLAAWIRLKYPTAVAGAIASSAPVWGLPHTLPRLDGAFTAIARGVGGAGDVCHDNILGSWPLIRQFGRSVQGRRLLSDAFRLCNPLDTERDVEDLRMWLQDPWFYLAEGNFPYPSSYISSAVGPGNYELPAWPLQTACGKGLGMDWGIGIQGSKADVRFVVSVDVNAGNGNGNDNDDESWDLDVDWDTVTPVLDTQAGGKWNDGSNSPSGSQEGLEELESTVVQLFESLRDAVGIWYNITNELQCYDVRTEDITATTTTLANTKLQSSATQKDVKRSLTDSHQLRQQPLSPNTQTTSSVADKSAVCDAVIARDGSWEPLCCNENLNLPIYYTMGMGNDCFWPPSDPRGTTYADIVSSLQQEKVDVTCARNDESLAFLGYPAETDYQSDWLDDYYGGDRFRYSGASNIVFANGLLDPWSAAGVYTTLDPPSRDEGSTSHTVVQNMTHDGTIVSLVLDLGAHHLDLMFAHPDDPPCANEARLIQEEHIRNWIQEWNLGEQTCVRT